MVYYVPMGLFDRFRATQQENPVDVAASLSPYNAQQLVGGILFGTTTATREQYMAIPSAARARRTAKSIAHGPSSRAVGSGAEWCNVTSSTWARSMTRSRQPGAGRPVRPREFRA